MEPQVLAGAQALIDRCRPVLYVENNEPGASKRLSEELDRLGYAALWSIFPYFDQRNFYSNPVNIWENVVPAANLLWLPRKRTSALAGMSPSSGRRTIGDPACSA